MNNKTLLYTGIVLFTVLSVLDIISTMIALSNNGIEANPLFKPLLPDHLFIALFIKMLIILIVVSCAYIIERKHKWMGNGVIYFQNSILLLVVLNNLNIGGLL